MATRVLADHRVEDEQDLVGLDGVADVARLLHQLVVDAEAAGGVDDDDVVLLGRGELDRLAATRRPGRRLPLPASGAKTAHAGAARRPPGAGCTALGRWRSAATSSGCGPGPSASCASLPASVVLPAPCRPASMMTVGGVLANRIRRVSPPRIVTSSSSTILTTCWRRVQRLGDLGAARALRDRVDEVLDHRQRDVGLEQRDPDLAQGGVDVGLGQPALAAQALQRVGEPVLKVVNNVRSPSVRSVQGIRRHRFDGQSSWSARRPRLTCGGASCSRSDGRPTHASALSGGAAWAAARSRRAAPRPDAARPPPCCAAASAVRTRRSSRRRRRGGRTGARVLEPAVSGPSAVVVLMSRLSSTRESVVFTP